MPTQRGFTFIELLIVVAIIGILAAVVSSVQSRRNDPSVMLKTKDWQCLKTEPKQYTYTTMAGKAPITQHGVRDECVEWRRVAN